MSYDTTLQKPAAAVLDDNRIWASHLLQSFADLEDAQVDVQANADVAEDVGMSEEEWVRRGMGVSVHRRGQSDFVEISFWETTAEIALPNITESEGLDLLNSISPYIGRVRELGFVLIDPLLDEPVERDRQIEKLLAGYDRRQQTVGGVADLIGGEAPGRRK